MKFHAVIMASGKTATGIQVPDEVVAALGTSKRPPVRVTIEGYTYRTTVGSMGGLFMIPVSAEHRSGAGVNAGDKVEVDIELDTEVRERRRSPHSFRESSKGWLFSPYLDLDSTPLTPIQ